MSVPSKSAAASVGGEGAEAVAHAALLHLDQRFQPDHAARAGAHDLDRNAPRFGLGLKRARDILGTQRLGGGVTRNVDLHGATSATSASARTRPRRAPSTIAAGPQAQSPRQ